MPNHDDCMQELLLFLTETLVSDRQSVKVWKEQKLTASVLKVKVADGDAGRIIGKNGRIAKALRVIIKSSAARLGLGKYFVDITRSDLPS